MPNYRLIRPVALFGEVRRIRGASLPLSRWRFRTDRPPRRRRWNRLEIAGLLDGDGRVLAGGGQLLLTPEQAAQRLALGRTRVYALLRGGAIESVKIGRSRRIPLKALERYVAQLCVEAGEPLAQSERSQSAFCSRAL